MSIICCPHTDATKLAVDDTDFKIGGGAVLRLCSLCFGMVHQAYYMREVRHNTEMLLSGEGAMLKRLHYLDESGNLVGVRYA